MIRTLENMIKTRNFGLPKPLTIRIKTRSSNIHKIDTKLKVIMPLIFQIKSKPKILI